MNIINREAYIRVTVTHIAKGLAYCVPVNKVHEAFDGAGSNALSPGKLVVHTDAIVPSPLDIEIEPCALEYGGKQINRAKKGKS